jgi:hypothetical protein
MCVIRSSQKLHDIYVFTRAQEVDIALVPQKVMLSAFKNLSEPPSFLIILLFDSFILDFLKFVIISLKRVQSISPPGHVPRSVDAAAFAASRCDAATISALGFGAAAVRVPAFSLSSKPIRYVR